MELAADIIVWTVALCGVVALVAFLSVLVAIMRDLF